MNRAAARLKTIESQEQKPSNKNLYHRMGFTNKVKLTKDSECIKAPKKRVKEYHRFSSSFIKPTPSNQKRPPCYQTKSIMKTQAVESHFDKKSSNLKKTPKKSSNGCHLIQSTSKKPSFSFKQHSQPTSNKKHSYSVFQFGEQEPKRKSSGIDRTKVNSRIENYSNWKDRSSHNHSTSTKKKPARKPSIKAPKGSITNSEIEDKIKQFKIISKCLRVYIEEEHSENKSVESEQIIKMVRAFNKSEISTISKPLEQLIADMIKLIQDCCKKQQQIQPNPHERQSRKETFEEEVSSKQTPNMESRTFHFETPQNRRSDMQENKIYGQQIEPFKAGISNEVYSGESYAETFNPHQNFRRVSTEQTEQRPYTAYGTFEAQNIMSNDIISMEKSLIELQYESNRLRQLLDKGSAQKESGNKANREKQLKQLREILESQESFIQALGNVSNKSSGRDEGQSQESSLKYEPRDGY